MEPSGLHLAFQELEEVVFDECRAAKPAVARHNLLHLQW
jgi:hypothetical protein